MTPKMLDAGQALTREMGKPGNVLKALDAHLKNPRQQPVGLRKIKRVTKLSNIFPCGPDTIQ